MKFKFDLEDIKYIKILYKDTDDNPATIKAAIKRIDEKEIFACSKFEEGLYIETPQEITLSIICGDGLYRTKTKLKSIENDEPYTFFALESPLGLEYQQNREYFRVSAQFPCIYTVGSQEFKTQTCDISANGVSIVLPAHLITENDSMLALTFDGITIETQVRYVRSEKIEDGYKLSFTFTKISELDRDFISQVCIKKQLEQKRNSIH